MSDARQGDPTAPETDVEAAWATVSGAPPDPQTAPPDPQTAPPDPQTAAKVNGVHASEAEVGDSDDLHDWSRGAEALARLPLRTRLSLTRSIPAARAEWSAELERATGRVDRLRYDTVAMIDSGSGQRLGVRTLAEMSMEPPPPMLLGRLDPTGHTVLFGAGGTGKGLLAAWWTLALTRAGQRVIIVDYENHPDEWARRVYAMGGADVLTGILHVAPLTARWGGKRGALWDQADDLRGLAADWGAAYLVIDSIVPACSGSDPLKPESVSQYAGALELIGLPALSLGHVTKADDLRYPFGSVFWHNLSRVTWSAKKTGERILLTHRKHNNYERHPATLLEVAWLDGLPVDVSERPAGEELAARITVVLRSEPLTVRQICARLDDDLEDEEDEPAKPDSVSRALRRGQKERPARFVKVGSDRWTNG